MDAQFADAVRVWRCQMVKLARGASEGRPRVHVDAPSIPMTGVTNAGIVGIMHATATAISAAEDAGMNGSQPIA